MSFAKFVWAFLSATFLFTASAYTAEQPVVSRPQNEVLKQLKEGNKRFVDNKLTYCLDISKSRAEAQIAHEPIAAILSCSDARVGPEIVFDQGVGDLFVVRVAGNVLSDYGIGSLEYAVHYLHAPLIVVLGHSRCGAMEAFLKTIKQGSFLEGHIETLVLAAYPASRHLKNLYTATTDDLVLANVRTVCDELINTSPLIGKKVSEGTLKIVGAVYDLSSGVVTFIEDK